MVDVTLFDKLKKYLTTEFMELSKQKDEILCEKVRLEVEKKQDEHQLFENKDAVRIKRLFSPLDDEVFVREDFNTYQNNKIKQKIQNIETKLNQMESSMEDIKEYLCFVQMLENIHVLPKKEEVSKEEQQEKGKIAKWHQGSETSISCVEQDFSPGLSQVLRDTITFLQERYPDTELLLDFEDHQIRTEEELNRYFVRILTYTISASIEAAQIDTVIIEGKVTDHKIIVSLQMLLDDQVMDQYSYQYEIDLKIK